ncbi:chemotaxis protein CheZ [Luteimonas sp. J16]|jgi:chemotaxis protein CheZ|uniref:protein phosphatase CheZ n=1 Tax=unclassified Luteimonas TaxID=2629088 RepID=UPI00047A3A54|nr:MULTISPECIES: protein phosphatase CheZ [unclassified Luteimonas]TWG93722.1 chemotaxis protein CheZ [Luteimonas sp. J16]
MNATAAPAQSREALVACLHAALDALEQDDDGAWRRAVDELVQWRTQPLVQGLVRLARELETTLGTGGGNGSLHEACLRLEHVVKVSEDASHHTLDLIQDCGILLGTLGGDGHDDEATVAAIRSRLSEMTAAQGYQDLTGQIIRRVVELVRAVHEGLGEYAPGTRPLQLDNRGHGPAVAGLDDPAATQDDANQLLSSLGL